MQNNTLRGLVFAMAVVIVLMGGIIASQQARMAGMLDAFNIIREKLVKGEFDRTGGRY